MTGWAIREDLGQPEVSYAIEWPEYDPGGMSDRELQELIEQTSAYMDTCATEHLAAAQSSYWNNAEAETLRRLSIDERWERSMPAILECFAAASIPVDPDATRSEIAAQFDEIDDPQFAACVVQTDVFVDLGNGAWEFEY